jgi:aspartate aminotransferase
MLNDDEVILPAPYCELFWNCKIIWRLTGCGAYVYENDFKITPTQLEAAITPKTKMMWFSSPCNPSGSVYSRRTNSIS